MNDENVSWSSVIMVFVLLYLLNRVVNYLFMVIWFNPFGDIVFSVFILLLLVCYPRRKYIKSKSF